MAERDRAGLAIALALIALGVAVLVATTQMSPMGAVFPRTIAVVMVVAAALLAVQSLRRRSQGVEGAAENGSMTRRVLVMVTMLAWALLLPVVGFVETAIVGFLALFAIANHDGWQLRRTLLYAGVGVVTVVLAWLLLSEVLNVPLPRGLLF